VNQPPAGRGVIDAHTFNLPVNDIDTDQIIPAQFLTTTERAGLGQYCFYAWRFDDAGRERADNPLLGHDPERHRVLVAGHNFGCGSSREHAPWALLDYGFQAVISSGFADIFRSNALKNGLLPVQVDSEVCAFLLEHPDQAVHIDIGQRLLRIDGFGELRFPLDAFAAYCLTRGIDQLEFLLQNEAAIEAFETRHARDS
jgi:3-isopropylmalate/(R)-2-methylmalate dehydratase small subunit